MTKCGIAGLAILITFGLIATTGYAQPVFVNGIKFYDYNKDGESNGYDFALEGWNMSLYWLNNTPVSGMWNISNEYGLYNISGVDAYFNYTVREDLQPGWTATNLTSQGVAFISCGDGGNLSEFSTTQSNLNNFMKNVPDDESYVLYGYNARIGDAVHGSNEDEYKLFYPEGQWSAGQGSKPISPLGNFIWQNDTFVPFNATFMPEGTLGIATWSINNSAPLTNDTPGFPDHPNSVPIRDIVIRLHSENSEFAAAINNVTLKQVYQSQTHTYNLLNQPLSFSEISSQNQDLYLVLRASNILIADGGADLATGGFSLTGDMKFIWPPDAPGNPVPQNNEIKVDFLVGQYDCYPVYGAIRNFGNYRGGNISGYKLDSFGNGLSSWNITLTNETFDIHRNEITGPSGYYLFEDVPVGIYLLNETLGDHPNWTPVIGNRTVEINLSTWDLVNQNFTNTLMAGNVSGYKLNESGYGLSGWNITVTNESAGFQAFNTTNDTGYYFIQNVPPNTYWLNETLQPGWIQVTPNRTIELNGSYPSLENQNFTNQQQFGYISGYKLFPNQTGIPNWTIELYNESDGGILSDSLVTDGNGFYNFTGLPYGVTFNVSEVIPAGWTPVGPTHYNGLVIDGDLSYENQNFTNEETTYCIEGYKLDNCTGMGLADWNITISDDGGEVGNTTTDQNGFYQVCGLVPDEYTVCEQLQPGWTNVTPLCVNVTLGLGNQTGINFTNTQLLCIEGYKLDEQDEAIPDWNITVSKGGMEVANTTTDQYGFYQFCGLVPGDYTVCEEIQQGWGNVSPACVNVTLNCTNQTGVNFTNVQQFGFISGYKIWFETGSGLDGWTIDLYNQTDGNTFVASTVTSGGGFYNFTGLPLGTTYNVSEVVQPGWTPVGPTFVPDLLLNATNPSYVNVNFTNDPISPGTGTIKGNKFEEDCIQTGCGLPGWTITLYYAGNGSVYNSILTGPCGSFEFVDVPFGTYLLNETLQPGWIQVTPNTTVTLDSNHTFITFDFINKKNTTCCACPPTTTFTYEKKGQMVNFTDTSTGPIETRWIWFFGDGTISTEQNPTKVYTKPGAYTVRMYILWQNCPAGSPGYWKSYSQRITVP